MAVVIEELQADVAPPAPPPPAPPAPAAAGDAQDEQRLFDTLAQQAWLQRRLQAD